MFTVPDKSAYLKGLLVLAKMDNRLFDSEKEIIREAANRLGFSKDFSEETLKSLLYNDYLDDGPVKFSNEAVAEVFINDGLRLAYADHDFSEEQSEWLERIAEANDVPVSRLERLMSDYRAAATQTQTA
jgi:uncharacterized tellurite resistance protein B-like protein